MVAALASWLDAKAHQGQWLVRIEDVDTSRCVQGADHFILSQLSACGLHPDLPPVWQSRRTTLYQQALDDLLARTLAYPCSCSRKDIETALQELGREKPRHGELIYPGTCRTGLNGKAGRAWRLLTQNLITWRDRRLGIQEQDVTQTVGDFILKRADGLFAYQLAVVVDDSDQGITHVVRGEDLADNTPRQIGLQRALGLPTLSYLHTPLVVGSNGEKLSKQNGAQPIDCEEPLWVLQAAGAVLGISVEGSSVSAWLQAAVACWVQQLVTHYNRPP